MVCGYHFQHTSVKENIISEFPNHLFSRNNSPELFLSKGVLKTCSKFIGENRCRSAISMKLLCNFIEVTLRRGYSPVNLFNIFKTLLLGIALHGGKKLENMNFTKMKEYSFLKKLNAWETFYH